MSSSVVVLVPEDRLRLEVLSRSRAVSASLVERARIVLSVADGAGTSGTARVLGVTRPTVIKWRDRFVADGFDGLVDGPRSGRPKTVDDDRIIAATLEPPPESLGVTHWSSRLLAPRLGVSPVAVVRAWERFGVKPWRRETFKFSTDPELEAKIRDVVGLYLNPPENAVVLCVDEKTQIQALNRTAPILPLRPGLPEKATHDYVRNGTTALFAALEIATGQVVDQCYDKHTRVEFVDFLTKIVRAYPDQELHIVCDNYATHKHADVAAWLTRNPLVTLHFTPTSGSWLNMVETFFSIITRQAITRGSFDSVKELIAAIRRFIDHWNTRCHPFTWTKTPDQIIPKATRQRTNASRH